MSRTSLQFSAIVLAVVLTFALWPAAVFADDFGDVVHHIETRYHAHRNYRFLMAFASFTVKFWPGTGVKDVRIAYFENQDLFQPDPDNAVEEIVQNSGRAEWRPLVKSWSRRSGNHSYVYAQPVGKDLKLLVVDVERNEATVIEVKIDPDKLEKFIDEHEHHSREGVM